MNVRPHIPASDVPPIATDPGVGREAFRSIDRMREALSAQITGGLSPAALMLASFDWTIHLASSPGKRMELAVKAAEKAGRLWSYLIVCCAWSALPHVPRPSVQQLSGK